MRKNIFLIAFSLVMLLLGTTSCEQELSAEDCAAINAMEINTTELKASEDNKSVAYAFTPSNAKFLNLDYTWSVNGQEIEDVTKSLFQYTFTENGTFEVCFVAIPKNGSSCVVESICTSLTIDSLEIEEAAEGCDTIEFSQIAGLSANASGLVSVPVQVKNADNLTIKWFLNGEELSNEDRQAFGSGNVLNNITVYRFDEAGSYDIKVIASSESCEGKQLSVTAVVDADLGVTISDQKIEEVPAEEEGSEESEEPTSESETACDDLELGITKLEKRGNRAILEIKPRDFFRNTVNETVVEWTINGKVFTREELGQSPGTNTSLFTFTQFKDGLNTVEVKVTTPSACAEGVVLKGEVVFENEAAPVAPVTPVEEEPAAPVAPVTPAQPVTETPPTPSAPPVQLTCNDLFLRTSFRSTGNGPKNIQLVIEPRGGSDIRDKNLTTIVWTIDGAVYSEEDILKNPLNTITRVLGDFSNIRVTLEPGQHTIEAQVTSANICSGGVTLKETITIQ
ncbi:hypothetical protein [Aquimarina agarivorans]|uniref:hypothetical protein n=1 Tax=Aquimarina agarivorans TaxID=980584 RepID=UPI000248EAF3|nr:hypothetical protein [Aquimarina agarivorans]